jgi:hypothetical protein
MRAAINNPAWGILDDWREVAPRSRTITIYRSAHGYNLSAAVYGSRRGKLTQLGFADAYASDARDLENAARKLISCCDYAVAAKEAEDLTEARALLERHELEAASSVELPAADHELASGEAA